jgi:carboxymethylenebutenolidase
MVILFEPIGILHDVHPPDGAFSAYVARPAAASAPAIVVLHEVFGVNADLRETCHELADKGYIAICPDLFWHQEPGVDLPHWTEAEWRKGLALYSAYDFDAGVSGRRRARWMAHRARSASWAFVSED